MTAGAPRVIVLVSGHPDLALPLDGGLSPFRVVTVPWDELVASDPSTAVDVADPCRAAVAALEHRVIADEPHVVCIGDDVPDDLAFGLGSVLDEEHPEISVILLREPTPELWRQAARSGVRDVIDPWSNQTDLRAAIEQVADRADRLRASLHASLPGRSARVVAMLSPKGGSGKTMVAANLAVALALEHVGDVVLCDFDSVFGDVAGVLGIVPDRTVGQLAGIPHLDSMTLKVFLTRHERSGLYVLASAGVPEEGEAVTDELIGTIIDMLARDFAYVIVDTAAGLDERALASVERATDVVLLATLDAASIRNLGKAVDALDRLGLSRAARHFVLNRADSHVGLEVSDVEMALGMKVEAALPSSRLVPTSMNEGRALVLDQPDAAVARELSRLAKSFVPEPLGAEGASHGRFLFRRHRHEAL